MLLPALTASSLCQPPASGGVQGGRFEGHRGVCSEAGRALLLGSWSLFGWVPPAWCLQESSTLLRGRAVAFLPSQPRLWAARPLPRAGGAPGSHPSPRGAAGVRVSLISTSQGYWCMELGFGGRWSGVSVAPGPVRWGSSCWAAVPAGPGDAGAAGRGWHAAGLHLPGTVTSLLRPCWIPGAGWSRRWPIGAAWYLRAAGPEVPSSQGTRAYSRQLINCSGSSGCSGIIFP